MFYIFVFLKHFTLSELRQHLARNIIRKPLDGYKLHWEDKELVETRSGRNLTLQDLGIRKESTLFVRKVAPKVVNPKVSFVVNAVITLPGTVAESLIQTVSSTCILARTGGYSIPGRLYRINEQLY